MDKDTISPTSASLPEYTEADVAQHNTVEDCWIILTNEDDNIKYVYNLSSPAFVHPGGPRAMAAWAGKLGDEPFRRKPLHYNYARERVPKYLVGKLVVSNTTTSDCSKKAGDDEDIALATAAAVTAEGNMLEQVSLSEGTAASTATQPTITATTAAVATAEAAYSNSRQKQRFVDLSQLTVPEVSMLIDHLGLSHWRTVLAAGGVNGSRLNECSNADSVSQLLGVTSKPKAKYLWKCISQFKTEGVPINYVCGEYYGCGDGDGVGARVAGIHQKDFAQHHQHEEQQQQQLKRMVGSFSIPETQEGNKKRRSKPPAPAPAIPPAIPPLTISKAIKASHNNHNNHNQQQQSQADDACFYTCRGQRIQHVRPLFQRGERGTSRKMLRGVISTATTTSSTTTATTTTATTSKEERKEEEEEEEEHAEEQQSVVIKVSTSAIELQREVSILRYIADHRRYSRSKSDCSKSSSSSCSSSSSTGSGVLTAAAAAAITTAEQRGGEGSHKEEEEEEGECDEKRANNNLAATTYVYDDEPVTAFLDYIDNTTVASTCTSNNNAATAAADNNDDNNNNNNNNKGAVTYCAPYCYLVVEDGGMDLSRFLMLATAGTTVKTKYGLSSAVSSSAARARVLSHIAVQLMNAVSSIHALGLMHGDLKPANIMISFSPSPAPLELTLSLTSVDNNCNLSPGGGANGGGDSTGTLVVKAQKEEGKGETWDDFDVDEEEERYVRSLRVKLCDFDNARWITAPAPLPLLRPSAAAVPLSSLLTMPGAIVASLASAAAAAAPATAAATTANDDGVATTTTTTATAAAADLISLPPSELSPTSPTPRPEIAVLQEAIQLLTTITATATTPENPPSFTTTTTTSTAASTTSSAATAINNNNCSNKTDLSSSGDQGSAAMVIVKEPFTETPSAPLIVEYQYHNQHDEEGKGGRLSVLHSAEQQLLLLEQQQQHHHEQHHHEQQPHCPLPSLLYPEPFPYTADSSYSISGALKYTTAWVSPEVYWTNIDIMMKNNNNKKDNKPNSRSSGSSSNVTEHDHNKSAHAKKSTVSGGGPNANINVAADGGITQHGPTANEYLRALSSLSLPSPPQSYSDVSNNKNDNNNNNNNSNITSNCSSNTATVPAIVPACSTSSSSSAIEGVPSDSIVLLSSFAIDIFSLGLVLALLFSSTKDKEEEDNYKREKTTAAASASSNSDNKSSTSNTRVVAPAILPDRRENRVNFERALTDQNFLSNIITSNGTNHSVQNGSDHCHGHDHGHQAATAVSALHAGCEYVARHYCRINPAERELNLDPLRNMLMKTMNIG